jgi:Flp pilus assembly protein TadD
VNLCLTTFALESCDAAAGCLERVAQEAPDFGPAWRELALMLYRCGRTIEAESAAVRGLELAPGEARLRQLLERIEGERVGGPN